MHLYKTKIKLINLNKKTKREQLTIGFIIAGLMNNWCLVFSRVFTNTVIPQYDKPCQILMIVVWDSPTLL
jgi:hypothetical protein